MSIRFARVLACVAILLLPMPQGYGAQDEHNRRLAMELAVVSGDLHLLQRGGMARRHHRGLVARIRSALGYLGLLAREAQQASSRRDAGLHEAIRQARQDFLAGDVAATALALRRLSRAYPLDTRGILPAESTGQRLERGRTIDRLTCRACHIAPDTARDNPARDLFLDARTMPQQELVARLLAGVRGVHLTGLENPLSDEDLSSLTAWFRQGGRLEREASP